ncbi:hypothetical protein [Actinomadura sp. WAC 06369]|uniref:hypothetical protein n=1 Tax=Actinomadura sp. WAC 06369 TaxID=2203193 RepID=UPI000F7AE845|nr:hypothetical protein [Actinomadura sp. WAC 06369]RSN59567.1 hypothetical protein DMH08_22625 [Actinomadura sp. WAC 06369]
MKDTTGSLAIRLGSGAFVHCCTYPDAAPILTFSARGISFSLTNRERDDIDVGDVENARRLLEAVTTFVAEVERLHAANETAADPARDAAA